MPLPPGTLNQALDQLPQLLLNLGRLQQDRRDEELRREIQQASQVFEAKVLERRIAAEKEMVQFRAGMEAPSEPRIIEDVAGRKRFAPGEGRPGELVFPEAKAPAKPPTEPRIIEDIAGRKRFAPEEGEPGELVFPDVETPPDVSERKRESAATTKIHSEALRRWRNLRAEKTAYESKLKTYTTLVGTPEGIVARIIAVKWLGTNKPQQMETARKAVIRHGEYDPETFELKLLDEAIQRGTSPVTGGGQPTPGAVLLQGATPAGATLDTGQQGGAPSFEPTVASTTGQAIPIPDYVHPETGERVRWNGSEWITIE